MVEQVVVGQLQSFWEETSALDPFQSSFQPGHGVETALVTLTDDLQRKLDLAGSTLLFLLDLTAESDTVNHGLLAHCLADMGIQGTALKWLQSFLQGQEQWEPLPASAPDLRILA